jgi:hypothetical protein
MAHEILDNALLLPSRAENWERSESLMSSLIAAWEAKARAQDHRPDPSRTVVVHNFQYDIESIFWIALYTVTAHIDHGPGRKFAKLIFRNTVVLHLARAKCLEKNISDTLLEVLSPNVVGIALILEYLREKLLTQYHQRNTNRLVNGPSGDAESYAEIHNEFFVALRALATSFAERDPVALINETSYANVVATVPRPVKWPRSARDADDDDYCDQQDVSTGSERMSQPSKKIKRTTEV